MSFQILVIHRLVIAAADPPSLSYGDPTSTHFTVREQRNLFVGLETIAGHLNLISVLLNVDGNPNFFSEPQYLLLIDVCLLYTGLQILEQPRVVIRKYETFSSVNLGQSVLIGVLAPRD